MRAIVLAYHDMGCAGIESLLAHGYEIVGVFTHTDSKNENVWFGSVAELAARNDLKVFAPDDIDHPLWLDRIRELAPDVLFSFYYRKLVSKDLLAIPPKGCFNLHGSMLPKYRGCAPANWAILNGETETGVTLHHMTLRPDAGDIVGQRKVAIEPSDDAATLNRKLVAAARPLLDECLPLIRDGKAPRTPQDDTAATYFGRRSPQDGEIDWSKPARALANLVRAVTRPYPGAFTHARSTKVLIWQAEATAQKHDKVPGTIVGANPLEVACGGGLVREHRIAHGVRSRRVVADVGGIDFIHQAKSGRLEQKQ